MKLKFLLLLFTPVFFFKGFSQESRAFAITGQADANFNWTDIRVIDMASGNTNATLFENGKTKFSFVDAETRKAIDQFSFKGKPCNSSAKWRHRFFKCHCCQQSFSHHANERCGRL